MMGKFARTVFILLIIGSAFPAFSDYSDFYDAYSGFADVFQDTNTGLHSFPILTIPMGGRYEALGLAFTAVSDDIGFMESNPAGSSVLEYTSLSLLHNNWIADSRLEALYYSMRFDDIGFGVGAKFLYVPFTEYNDWGESQNSFYYLETLGTLNFSYNIASSYEFYGLALGANLKVGYRYIPEEIALDQSAVSVMGDIGLLTRFNFLKGYTAREKNFSLGLTLKNLGWVSLDDPLPVIASLGVAYKPVRPLLISLDFNWPFNLNKDVPNEKWDISAGIEAIFTDFFAMQAGFNYAGGNPKISLGALIDIQYVRFNINYTLGLDTQVQSVLDRFSVEATMNLGDEGRADISALVDEYYLEGVLAYAAGDLDRAIKYWEAALELDAHFQPAEDYIAIASKTRTLTEEMLQITELGAEEKPAEPSETPE